MLMAACNIALSITFTGKRQEPASALEPAHRPQMLPIGSSRIVMPASDISFLTNLQKQHRVLLEPNLRRKVVYHTSVAKITSPLRLCV